MVKSKLKGIAASNGVAFAKVFKLVEDKITIPNNNVNDVDAEIARYETAVQKSIEQIKKIYEIALKNLSPQEAEVFGAHIQVAEDPMIKEEIHELISKKQINAVMAQNEVAQKYIEMFQMMEDEYMKERAADIKDVSTRILKNLLGIEIVNLSTINEPTIIVAEDLTPSDTAQLNRQFVKGFLTNIGGRTSHSAIMARSLEIPAILGLGNITELVNNNDMVAINGLNGEVIINPNEEELIEFEKAAKEYEEYKNELQTYLNKKSLTKDGKEVLIAANIGSVADADAAHQYNADAIGLFRSEFLYMDANNWPTEEEQFIAYKAVLEKMGNKPVVVRTLDIGGDKTLKYFKFPHEMNPFLGYRAIRLSLDKKETFVTQLRALLRASSYGNLAIMFPMIATIEEFKEAKKIYEEVKESLIKENIPVSDNVEVGMMVEIPAAAVLADQFSKHADFVSLGTNDLMQYTMASDRMNEKVSYLYQPLNPSILKLIKMTIDGAHKNGIWAGMCGEMAGSIEVLPLLIGMGLDEFSMSATSMLEAKKIISKIDTKEAKELVDIALTKETEAEIKELVDNFLKKL